MRLHDAVRLASLAPGLRSDVGCVLFDSERLVGERSGCAMRDLPSGRPALASESLCRFCAESVTRPPTTCEERNPWPADLDAEPEPWKPSILSPAECVEPEGSISSRGIVRRGAQRLAGGCDRGCVLFFSVSVIYINTTTTTLYRTKMEKKGTSLALPFSGEMMNASG